MDTGEIEYYYNQGREQDRLRKSVGRIEFARTQEIILRYLPPPPLTIMDIGGGAGIHALWLAQRGYAVHLVDLMPLHIEQALEASAAQPDYQLASVRLGKAQQLHFEDESADAVLLLGPLYHLPQREDRLQAIRETYRILKPGGLLFAATISKFASMMEGIMRAFLTDPNFADGVENTLNIGIHQNPERDPGLFTTAYFHHPDDARQEVADAGFEVEAFLAIEGPASFTTNFDLLWDDDSLRERLLTFLRATETEPTLLGATGHLMTVGRKG
jgi:ubiquinone/menaquinone biosynthesis C-methylase UbiE